MWRTVLLAGAVLCSAELLLERSAPRIISDDETSYTDVIVKRINDTLSLTCVADRGADVRWTLPPGASYRLNESASGGDTGVGWVRGPRLHLPSLSKQDSGTYVCDVPPYSVAKYVVVQPPAPAGCARGGFSCGHHCVLPRYVCDGRPDCLRGEDESEATCGTGQPCYGKLQCDEGRCISEAWCCDPALERDCVPPACCERYTEVPELGGGYSPAPRAPDDYGFIQTSIYTVTACALIFMIAVVLLVSAICKMHMKRAALHSYARAERARQHYALPCQYPPRYEPRPLADTAPDSPQRQPAPPGPCVEPATEPEAAPTRPTNFGLGRLTDVVFGSRYRAVPTRSPDDVEMTAVPPALSPGAPDLRLCSYRSPACEIEGGEFYFAGDAACYGRDLNYSAPLDFYLSERERRRRATAVERLLDRITLDRGDGDRSLTLHLGRFQLSLPRLRRDAGRRPDTPNVAELNIDELDFVRLNSNETYTLNGRTIHLLGGDFENYPVLGDPAAFVGRVVAPPPYSESVAVAPSKVFGPPPAYLSRENLTDENRNVEDSRVSVTAASEGTDCNGNTQVSGAAVSVEAGAEPPPSYEELPASAAGCDTLDANANSTA